MRKLFTLLAILFAVSLSAQMRIWNNGQKMFEINLSMIDSITFVKSGQSGDSTSTGGGGGDSTVTPDPQPVTSFDYYNWRKQDSIKIYSHALGGKWQWVKLPWADISVTSMPESYRFPNLDVNIDTTKHDTVPVWNLAFNLCPESTLDGVHMFGLWDSKSAVMRIYSYIEELPNPNATYFFYEMSSSVSSFVERDAMTWMPSDSIIKKSSWTPSAISNADDRPSTTQCQLMPIVGTLDDQINRGWLCFEVNLSAGDNKVPSAGSVSFTLYGVQQIDLRGTDSLGISLNCDTCSMKGQITIPGNKQKMAGALVTAIGGLVSGLATAATQAATTQNILGTDAGYAVGGAAAAGAIISYIGNTTTAEALQHDEELKAKMSLSLNFHGNISGQFNGQLKSRLGTSVSPVTMSYNAFFDSLNVHKNEKPASMKRRTNSVDSISIGAWNLKKQPVYYVCGDTRFEDGSLISFLDPTSIELLINEDNPLFDADEIDAIDVVAYDFALADNYYISAEPYYNFYGIPRDPINTTNNLVTSGLASVDYMLEETDDGRIYTKEGIDYIGHAAPFTEKGWNLPDIVYSPQIVDQLIHSIELNYLGVAVLVEMTFRNGEKRFFAERFLPQIKTFNLSEAQTLINKFQDAHAPSYLEGKYHYSSHLFEMQKEKALRILYAALYPVITIDAYNEVSGIRVRSWKNAQNPGIVIVTSEHDPGVRYTCETLYDIYQDIENLGFYDGGEGNPFDRRFRNLNLPELRGYKYITKEGWTFKNGSCSGKEPDYPYYFIIYHEDAQGNLTLYSE